LSGQSLLGNYLFRRERGDDFFEARIAPQRIPHRTQTQHAVAWARWDFRNCFELLDGQVAFATPRVGQCQVGYSYWAVRRVFCDGHELDRPPAFAQRLISDHTILKLRELCRGNRHKLVFVQSDSFRSANELPPLARGAEYDRRYEHEK
jgi:hypothetical protein